MQSRLERVQCASRGRRLRLVPLAALEPGRCSNEAMPYKPRRVRTRCQASVPASRQAASFGQSPIQHVRICLNQPACTPHSWFVVNDGARSQARELSWADLRMGRRRSLESDYAGLPRARIRDKTPTTPRHQVRNAFTVQQQQQNDVETSAPVQVRQSRCSQPADRQSTLAAGL